MAGRAGTGTEARAAADEGVGGNSSGNSMIAPGARTGAARALFESASD